MVASGGAAEPGQSAAANYVNLADKATEVREVLALLSKPESALGWFDLYKIYEIVCAHVTGSPICRQKALTATRWVTNATSCLHRFGQPPGRQR
jgi:hypothetical protein